MDEATIGQIPSRSIPSPGQCVSLFSTTSSAWALPPFCGMARPNNRSPLVSSPHIPTVDTPSRFRRRLIARSLTTVPIVVTAVHVPVLATTAQTASAYGSVLASAQPGQPSYTSSPQPLSVFIAEVRAALDACAKRLSEQKSGGLLGGLLNTVTSLLNSLLGLVNSLFSGLISVSQLKVQSPDLYKCLESYRSTLWRVSPVTLFSTAIGQLQNFGPMSLLDVALDSRAPLGQYFVAAYLNTTASGLISTQLLWPERVRTIAYELNSKGFFEPTSGIRWDSMKVVEWWRMSLGLML